MPTIQVAAFVALSGIIHFLLLRSGLGRIPVPAVVVLGALLSVVVYQLWAYVDLGLLDPFFQIAAAIQLGVSLVIGAVVAVILKVKRGPQVRAEP